MSKFTVPDGKLSLVSKNEALTVRRQCELLGINRTSFYYEPSKVSEEAILQEDHIKHRLDFWHTQYCWMGSRRLLQKLRQDDKIANVGRKLIRRYMQEMGIFTVYPKPSLSKPGKGHKKFPYLLRNMNIWLPNQVWAVDITYVSLGRTHMYLTVIIDWYSRLIVGWALSDTLETTPILEMLNKAFETYGIPAIINSDQGSQFTSDEYVRLLRDNGIRQSMDGKARWVDNVIIERWFRSLKTEEIYINEYKSPKELRRGIHKYIETYNHERPHAGISDMRPAQAYAAKFIEQDDYEAA